EGLTFSDVQNFNLIIWDDLGFQTDGITDNDVSIFQQAHEAGISLYFIGDDLAYSTINLSAEKATQWTNLLHLNYGDNFGGNETVSIINTTHPVTNGPFGIVADFNYPVDIDAATRTSTGEMLLGTSGSSDALLAFEDATTRIRSVTQNVTV